MTELTETRKRRYMNWAADVELWKQSGLKMKTWCKLNGINYESFRTRKRKLQEIAEHLQCSDSEGENWSNEFFLIPTENVSIAAPNTNATASSVGLKVKLTMENTCLELEGATNENLQSIIEVMKHVK